MNISSRCEYGYRAILELAGAERNGPLTVEAIAERRNIPEKFLVHILLQLKRAGIVRSVRGARGGYLLSRRPEAISLLDVIEAIEGPVLASTPSQGDESPEFTSAWREVTSGVSEVLSRTSIRQILDKSAASSMYYI